MAIIYRTPENLEKLRKMAAAKVPTIEIAREFGCRHNTVRAWARQMNIKLNSQMDSSKDPSVKKNRTEGIIAAWRRPEVRAKVKAYWSSEQAKIHQKLAALGKRRKYLARKAQLSVPSWVPEQLKQKYINRAHKNGELEAAAWARKQKQKMNVSGTQEKRKIQFQQKENNIE